MAGLVAAKFRRHPNYEDNLTIPMLVTAVTLEVGTARKPAKGTLTRKTKKRRKTAKRCPKEESKPTPTGFLQGRIGTFLATTSEDSSKPPSASTASAPFFFVESRRLSWARCRPKGSCPKWAMLSRQRTIGCVQEKSCGLHSPQSWYKGAMHSSFSGGSLALSHSVRFSFRQVFRVYDNRMIHTDRIPDSDDKRRATTVCELMDDSDDPLLEFR